jgi:HEAT repeat protein/lipopolysaccharide biosynthesis regulator YciM
MELSAALERLFPLAISLLTDSDSEVRKSAIVTLSKLRGQMASEIIFDRFQNDNIDDSLALILSKVDQENASRLLVSALNDPNVETRLAAAEALVKQRSEVSGKVLAEALKNYLDGVKDENQPGLISEEALLGAIKALGEIGDQDGRTMLQEMLLKERNSRLRATAISALGVNVKGLGQAIFQRFLKDPDPRVRSNAIDALGKFDNKALIGILQPSLFGAHQRVKANAAMAIWKYGDYDVTTTLKEMLLDKDQKQRVSGIHAIGELKLEVFWRQILKALKDEDQSVRRNAVIAVRKFARPDGGPKLQEIIDDPVPEVRLEVVFALAHLMKGEAAETLLFRCENEPASHIRSVIMTLLGKHGSPGIFPRMSRFLSDPDGRVAANTIEAVFQIQPSKPSLDMISPIRKFLTSENNRAKGNAIRGLWNWGFHEVLGSLSELLTLDEPMKKRTGLFCLGEVFAAVSAKGGDGLAQFNGMLVKAVQDYQRQRGKVVALGIETQIKNLWEKVEERVKSGKNDEAKEFLEEILKIDPRHQPSLISLGDLYLRGKNTIKAEEIFLRALAANQQLIKAHYALGQMYHQTGQWEKASRHLLAVVNLHPKLVPAHVMLGDALEKQNKLKDANDLLKRLQAHSPPTPGILSTRARLCFLLGSIGEAVTLVRSVAAQGKLDACGRFILGFGEHLGGNTGTGFLTVLSAVSDLLENPGTLSYNHLKRLIAVAKLAMAQKAGIRSSDS